MNRLNKTLVAALFVLITANTSWVYAQESTNPAPAPQPTATTPAVTAPAATLTAEQAEQIKVNRSALKANEYITLDKEGAVKISECSGGEIIDHPDYPAGSVQDCIELRIKNSPVAAAPQPATPVTPPPSIQVNETVLDSVLDNSCNLELVAWENGLMAPHVAISKYLTGFKANADKVSAEKLPDLKGNVSLEAERGRIAELLKAFTANNERGLTARLNLANPRRMSCWEQIKKLSVPYCDIKASETGFTELNCSAEFKAAIETRVRKDVPKVDDEVETLRVFFNSQGLIKKADPLPETPKFLAMLAAYRLSQPGANSEIKALKAKIADLEKASAEATARAERAEKTISEVEGVVLDHSDKPLPDRVRNAIGSGTSSCARNSIGLDFGLTGGTALDGNANVQVGNEFSIGANGTIFMSCHFGLNLRMGMLNEALTYRASGARDQGHELGFIGSVGPVVSGTMFRVGDGVEVDGRIGVDLGGTTGYAPLFAAPRAGASLMINQNFSLDVDVAWTFKYVKGEVLPGTVPPLPGIPAEFKDGMANTPELRFGFTYYFPDKGVKE